MRGQPIGRVRFVAVSATVPNLQVHGRWPGGRVGARPGCSERAPWRGGRDGGPSGAVAAARPRSARRRFHLCPASQDLAHWLGAPPAGVKAFGGWAWRGVSFGGLQAGGARPAALGATEPDMTRRHASCPAGEEMRPVKLRTVVRGYQPTKTGAPVGGVCREARVGEPAAVACWGTGRPALVRAGR